MSARRARPHPRHHPPSLKKLLAAAWKFAKEDPRTLRVLVIGLLVIAGLGVLYHYVDADRVHDFAARLNGGVAFALLTALPLFGFPVNVLHVAAGVRFGFVAGMALVALSILLQLLASYGLVHLWPKLFARHLARVRERIPSAAHGTVCIFTLLIPGIPYFIQNYTLALIGVPLRTYLSRCLPLHTARAILTVGLGQQSGHFSPLALAALAAYWVLVLGASWWSYRRLRAQLSGPPAAAGGRTPPA